MRRRLRSALCVALCALVSVGCGGAATSGHGSTLPSDESSGAHDGVLACGTYTRVRDDAVQREGDLDGMPYLEVVIGEADPCAPLPLVVVLHGLGDRPDTPTWPYRDLPVAVRVVLPHGPIPWGEGYAWSSVRVLDGEEEGLVATMRVQAERMHAFLEAMPDARPTRGEVILTGFSQGGILALTTLMLHPAHLALVLPMAAWVPPELRAEASAAPPVRWIHGIEDERVPFSMAVEAITDLRGRGYDVELVAYEGERHHMSETMDVRFHQWLAQALANQASDRPITEGFVLVP